MPYIKHEDGLDAAMVYHNASSTLGGLDELIRCRGHFPDPAPCDDVLYAWVPDEDVCPNCQPVSEESYDDFHSQRTAHIYEHQFLPALEHSVRQLETAHTDAGNNIVELEREKGRPNAKAEAVLAASELALRLHELRRQTEPQKRQLNRALALHREEFEQVQRDIEAKGDSVRKRRRRQSEHHMTSTERVN